MKKKFTGILALALVFTMALTSCGGSGEKPAADSDEWKGSVAMAFPGLITDEAFNQFTYEGLMKAVEEKGIKKYAYKENVAQDEQVRGSSPVCPAGL